METSVDGHESLQTEPSTESFLEQEQPAPENPLAVLQVHEGIEPTAFGAHTQEEEPKTERAQIEEHETHWLLEPAAALSWAQSETQWVWAWFKQPGEHAVLSTQAV
ncbi:Hypothetical_protein [Hexamita inflata]|uniref:Hypothetical_protein n=1 Tax=Hexamita inflata TaxID=28002 RepID=A0AA86PUQ7_9EUKA|nr:Hypothetical protein HINF_LOCUS32816 [Hexamita inflata]